MKNFSISVLAGAAFAALGASAAAADDAASAATAVATPVPIIFLDYSNVIATGSNIFLNRLPIRLPTGAIIYKDVTIHLNSDANGLLSVSIPRQALSPPVLSANFRAGIYALPSSTSLGFALTGPGVVSGNVVSKWETNATPTKSSNTCGIPAIFYVGPLIDNPFYASRLKPAGITKIEYSYGILESPGGCGSNNWLIGAIVGFSQSGGQLTIASFTDSSFKDHNVPVAIYTYKLQ